MTNNDSVIEQLQMENARLRQRLAELERPGQSGREADEKYAQLLETMDEGAIIVDDVSRVTYTNGRACEILVCPPEHMLGMPINNFLDDANRGLLRNLLTTRVKIRRRRTRMVWQSRDGQKIPASVNTLPLYDAARRMKGSLITLTDVRGLEGMTAATANEGTDYRLVFEILGDAVFIHDPEEGAILDVNPAACALFGYSRTELLDLGIEELSADEPPYTRYEAMAAIKRTVSEGPQTFEWLARHRSGDLFWVEVQLALGERAGAGCLVAVVRDIRRRKRLEHSLRKHAKDYQRMLDALPAGVALRDKEGKYLRVNRTLAELVGIPEEKWVGRSIQKLLPAAAEAKLEADREVLASGEPKRDVVERLDTRHGPRTVRTDVLPCRDSKGRVVGIVEVSRSDHP